MGENWDHYQNFWFFKFTVFNEIVLPYYTNYNEQV
jgi:hypothetical protein